MEAQAPIRREHRNRSFWAVLVLAPWLTGTPLSAQPGWAPIVAPPENTTTTPSGLAIDPKPAVAPPVVQVQLPLPPVPGVIAAPSPAQPEAVLTPSLPRARPPGTPSLLPAPAARLGAPVTASLIGDPLGGNSGSLAGIGSSAANGSHAHALKEGSADSSHNGDKAWSAEDWLNVPAIRETPRVGWFTLPPSGPGYYTFLDLLRGDHRPESPPQPFGRTASNVTPFYDRDFRYLDDPDNSYQMWSDSYKRIHLGDDFLVSTGGELRYRFNNYTDYNLKGMDNPYDLTRLRVYGDFWYRDEVRVYVEMIDARAYNSNQPIGGADDTGTDLLNAFVEAKLFDLGDGRGYVRAGRQELVLGSERLVSSPDWSNTLRTYDGVRALYTSDKWAVDLFWVRPVAPNPNQFDSSDDHQNFSGLWVTYKPKPGTAIEAYILNLNNTASPATNGDTTTLGARFSGDVKKQFLFDFEGMTQTGTSGSSTINAQAFTSGLGWHFANLPWNLNFWAYYDYASGNNNPTGNVDRTFNQLFPAGHTYFGYLDLVGRQNIEDLNFQFSANPQPWLTLLMQYHVFRLASSKDALYNAAGTAIRSDPTGNSGNDVGDELDLLTSFHLTPHQDVSVGYSELFAGEFLKKTGPGQNARLFYLLYTFRW